MDYLEDGWSGGGFLQCTILYISQAGFGSDLLYWDNQSCTTILGFDNNNKAQCSGGLHPTGYSILRYVIVCIY